VTGISSPTKVIKEESKTVTYSRRTEPVKVYESSSTTKTFQKSGEVKVWNQSSKVESSSRVGAKSISQKYQEKK